MKHDSDESTGEVPLSQPEVADEGKATVIAGRYEIVERIGAGGMGQILHVRHRRLDKSFALKLMHAEMSIDDEARALFKREAELASTLSHPNIISIIDFGDDPDWGLFLVMELLEGQTLADHIANGPPLSVASVCRIIEQLADAIHHSHANDIVHGDVKSENILCIDETDKSAGPFQVKLLDFGTARIATGLPGRDNVVTGTPAYMAPERIVGSPPAPSQDIYALGVVMFELLTGSLPFAEKNLLALLHCHLHVSPDSISDQRADTLEEHVEVIIEKAMAKDPGDRYLSALEFRDALRGCIARIDPSHLSHARLPEDEARARAAASDAFFQLGLPACGLSVAGTIVVASARFARLWGLDHPTDLVGVNILRTRLAALHPGLREDVRFAAMDGRTIRRRLRFRRNERDTSLRLLITPSRGNCGSCLVVLYPLDSSSRQPQGEAIPGQADGD